MPTSDIDKCPHDPLRERADFVCDSVGSLLTVRIRGEIDHHTAASIRRDVDALLYERKPKKLLLDLSAVTFMDSSGLGLIMGRLALVRELGGELVVWNPGRETCAILTLAGLERFVPIEYPNGRKEASDRAPARTGKNPGKSTGKNLGKNPGKNTSQDSGKGTGKRTSPSGTAPSQRRNTSRKEKDA